MSWDDSTLNDQNDTPGRLPLYAGSTVIGEAADTVVNGRHNALRWHEFSRTDAVVELTGHDYTVETDDEDELAERSAEDTAARLSQGASAGA